MAGGRSSSPARPAPMEPADQELEDLIGLASTGLEAALLALCRYHPNDLALSLRLMRIPCLAAVAVERVRVLKDSQATPALVELVRELQRRVRPDVLQGPTPWAPEKRRPW
jgi:hypothetical protein